MLIDKKQLTFINNILLKKSVNYMILKHVFNVSLLKNKFLSTPALAGRRRNYNVTWYYYFNLKIFKLYDYKGFAPKV